MCCSISLCKQGTLITSTASLSRPEAGFSMPCCVLAFRRWPSSQVLARLQHFQLHFDATTDNSVHTHNAQSRSPLPSNITLRFAAAAARLTLLHLAYPRKAGHDGAFSAAQCTGPHSGAGAARHACQCQHSDQAQLPRECERQLLWPALHYCAARHNLFCSSLKNA